MGQGLVTGAMFAGKPFQIRTGWTFVTRPTLVPGTNLAVAKFVLTFSMWSLAERAAKPLQSIRNPGTFRREVLDTGFVKTEVP